jgi:hypothetical protein
MMREEKLLLQDIWNSHHCHGCCGKKRPQHWLCCECQRGLARWRFLLTRAACNLHLWFVRALTLKLKPLHPLTAGKE